MFQFPCEEEALEQHRLNGTDRKKNLQKESQEEAKGTERKAKSEKGKAKDYSSTRFLYNETPSDDEEESERVLPSPERVKTNGNSNPRVEEEAKGTEEKSEKGKAKDIEEKKSTKEKEYSSTRFLYNETPSDDEEERRVYCLLRRVESERVLPSPERVKTNENSNPRVEEEAKGTEEKSEKGKAKDIEEKKSTKEKEYSSTRFLYNETPSDDEEESERVLPSPERVKTNGNSNPRVEEEAKGTERKANLRKESQGLQ
ncbi:hypothetical protein HAX54_048570 [Datura stramonium]|uniref:Uncharacterized protein n=1 Tax=Datura stramonium TaxID=4076 RepID=A0ABS8WN57_DATST|nr:hypothetical protein [Datura stramonium]